MRYDTIQNAITQHLQARIEVLLGQGTVHVIDLPETQTANREAYEKPRITVGYEGSSFEGSNTSSYTGLSQHETVTFSVLVQARSLYQSLGAHALVSATRYMLQGFEPPDCSSLILTGVEPLELNQGVFSYLLKFECKRISVGEEIPPDAPIFITQITLNPPIITID